MPKKIVLIIIGALLGFTGVLATLTGAAALVALGPHNTIRSGSHSISSPATALLSPPSAVQNEASLASALGNPTVHVQVTTATPGGVFIGIGPAAQVNRYLAGASVAVVNDLIAGHLNPRSQGGSATPALPGEQTFWVAHATGTSQADLTWTPSDGTYRVVVMRTDAKPGINVQARVGLTVPRLSGIATGLVVGGPIVLVLGGLALVFGILAPQTAKRSRRPTPRPTSTPSLTGPPLI